MIWPFKNIPDYKKDWVKGVNYLNMALGFLWELIFFFVFLLIMINRFNNFAGITISTVVTCLLYLSIAAISISISSINWFYPNVAGCGLESDPPSTSFACNYEGGACSNAPGYNDSGSPQCSDVNTEVYYNIESFKRYIVDEKVDDDEPSGSKYKFSFWEALYTEGFMWFYICIISLICILGVVFRGAAPGNRGIIAISTFAIYVLGIIIFILVLVANIIFFKENNPISHGIKNPLPPALLMIVSLFVGFYLTKPWPWTTQHYNSEIFRWMAFSPILFVQIIPGIQNYLDSNDSCINKTKSLCLNKTDNPCAWSGDENECKDYNSVFSPPPSTPPPSTPPPPPAPCSSYNDESGCNSGNNCYYVKNREDVSDLTSDQFKECINTDEKCTGEYESSCSATFEPTNRFKECCYDTIFDDSNCIESELISRMNNDRTINIRKDENETQEGRVGNYSLQSGEKQIEYEAIKGYCSESDIRKYMEAGIYA
jgi:hypothetical protein